MSDIRITALWEGRVREWQIHLPGVPRVGDRVVVEDQNVTYLIEIDEVVWREGGPQRLRGRLLELETGSR
jgi:hypothetical protein